MDNDTETFNYCPNCGAKWMQKGVKMDNKESKVLKEGLLYPTPNCVEYYQIVKATADEVAQRIFEAMRDFVQVVRCKDCRYYQSDGEWYDDDVCKVHPDDDNGFCAWGERRDDA